jgi:hypothetical protein
VKTARTDAVIKGQRQATDAAGPVISVTICSPDPIPVPDEPPGESGTKQQDNQQRNEKGLEKMPHSSFYFIPTATEEGRR